jgi:uncharacterized membrane protein
MSGLGWIGGTWGDTLAIAAMALATFCCRASGLVLMSRVRITPRIERSLRAIPGSIIMATILPIALDSGTPAFLGLGATILLMCLVQIELMAILSGLGLIALARAVGF